MAKYVVIEKCGDCPFIGSYYAQNCWICRKTEDFIMSSAELLKNCPLSDYNENGFSDAIGEGGFND